MTFPIDSTRAMQPGEKLFIDKTYSLIILSYRYTSYFNVKRGCKSGDESTLEFNIDVDSVKWKKTLTEKC